ncbi:hypothetical protein P389DRAFT_35667 [Cystobasidium minutum MCA 4210]|uniref:uncharacterized protein n=1 Tax=Cystobasidium minutum MCA 4210 TaxID=1397322 RepID=UPI0034CE3046|eukprot:jgi/Rhomi1/35667/CE35666_299
MSSNSLIKSTRQAIGGSSNSNGHNTGSAASTMSDATAQVIKRSKEQFITDMRRLLNEAKRHFGDVCWRLDGDDEVIYGHRAILYARANAAFQSRFLNPNGSARLQAIMSGSTLSLQAPPSPLVRSSSALPDTHTPLGSASPGALSVESFRSSPGDTGTPFGRRSPIPVSGTESAFFKSLLDFFYTASTPLGEVFTFLFEDSSYVDKEDALDRLSQDLLFMWRSKLFADMHIQLSETVGLIPEDDEEHSDTPLISEERTFPAHRAILAARCPYFASMFLSPYADSDLSLYTLPSPPFTPAALHFILAYLYTGSLSINRTFDLAVAMDIWKAATYLNHDLLQEDVQCRMEDMCHGFKACCKTCRNRAVRVYVFTTSTEVNAKRLQAQAKKVVLDHFGELWDKDIGNLPYATQKDLLVDKCSQTNASNAAAAMKGIMRIRSRLASERSAAWADHIKSMLLPLEDRIKHFLKTNFAEMAASKSFIDLVEGIGFSNDVLERLLTLLVEALSEGNAAATYEVLVGKLLLREEGIAMDARARLEDTRQDILKYIKARWIGIKSQNGFQHLENWCLKEISDELELPVDDLLQSATTLPQQTTRTGLKLSNTKVHRVDSDAFSVVSAPASLRASVLNKSAARKPTSRSSTHNSVFSIDPADPGSSTTSPPTPVAPTSGTSGRAMPRTSTVLKARTPSSNKSSGRVATPAAAASLVFQQGEATSAMQAASSTRDLEPQQTAKVTYAAKPDLGPTRAPVMTKSARLRQSSTASKLSAQRTGLQRLSRPSSSSSLRSTTSKDTPVVTNPARGNAEISESKSAQESASGRPVSVKSFRSRPTPVAVRSGKAETPPSAPATPNSPISQKASAASRPPSVTATAGRRRSSVSSVKSTRSSSSKISHLRKAGSPESPCHHCQSRNETPEPRQSAQLWKVQERLHRNRRQV